MIPTVMVAIPGPAEQLHSPSAGTELLPATGSQGSRSRSRAPGTKGTPLLAVNLVPRRPPHDDRGVDTPRRPSRIRTPATTRIPPTSTTTHAKEAMQ